MPKLGVITDGISREFEHALSVMNETGLEYAELQYLWEKEVGDLNDAEVSKVQSLIKAHNVSVSCISRHNFAGMLVGDTEVGDANYNRHMDGLQRCHVRGRFDPVSKGGVGCCEFCIYKRSAASPLDSFGYAALFPVDDFL